MACNSCAKAFSFFRKEKGCPGCGFSYCTNCLNNKKILPITNKEAKVCLKCINIENSNKPKNIEPPEAYFKRLDNIKSCSGNVLNQPKVQNKVDQDITARLHKLKQNSDSFKSPDEEIAKRLQNIKGDNGPSTSDTELHARLANLKGVKTLQSKPCLPTPDLRSEQEQADDLVKQFMAETKINTNYENEFVGLVSNMEARLQNLKASSGSTKAVLKDEVDEDNILKIIEKAKAEMLLEDEKETPKSSYDELPFCEICNEDAKMRCLGCRYLFCKRCFMEHKDEDDGCDRYEPFSAPKGQNLTF